MTISEVLAGDALVLWSYVAGDLYLYVYTSVTTMMMMERGVCVDGSGDVFFSALLVQYPMCINIRYAIRLQFLKLWSSDHVECLNFEYFFSAVLTLSNRDFTYTDSCSESQDPSVMEGEFPPFERHIRV
jgi:hypothetical protein